MLYPPEVRDRRRNPCRTDSNIGITLLVAVSTRLGRGQRNRRDAMSAEKRAWERALRLIAFQ
jgi:hypothetical protein